MKRFIKLCLVLIITTFSCEKDNELTIKTDLELFLETEDFHSTGLPIDEIDFSKSGIIEIIDNKSIIPLITIVFKKNNKINGILQAINLSNYTTNFSKLPNNHQFAMIYKDYSQYDHSTGDGIVTFNDLNYDNSKVLTFRLENETISKIEKKRIDYQVLLKYNYFESTINKKMDAIPSSCSGGSNGDVRWGECMHCLISICGSDDECDSAYDAADYGSSLVGLPPLGTLSFATSCVVISATR